MLHFGPDTVRFHFGKTPQPQFHDFRIFGRVLDSQNQFFLGPPNDPKYVKKKLIRSQKHYFGISQMLEHQTIRSFRKRRSRQIPKIRLTNSWNLEYGLDIFQNHDMGILANLEYGISILKRHEIENWYCIYEENL